jgi:hypothetical protein
MLIYILFCAAPLRGTAPLRVREICSDALRNQLLRSSIFII